MESQDGSSTRRGTGRQPSSGLSLVPEDELTMPFEPGQIVGGKYELIELIGVGGIGFVVAARHVELGEKVAIKFLRPEALANSEAVGRFAREARASAQIKSEHVVRVFDVGNLPDGSPFIVMEYLEGRDLSAIVQERGALPCKLAVEYVLQACEALASAHARGIVHRDVKPENLFLSHGGEGVDLIKVLDFGISKVALTGSAFESRHPLVRTTMAMGSPTYMSPEQIRASQDIDARTDVWSLGCVLYELVSGRPAFDAPSLTQITAVILEQEPTPLGSLCPGVPPELEAAVKRCLAKDPALRFQNVAELAAALYPYGPRRGRISVERCCSLLRSSGVSLPNFDLPSVYPPSISSAASAPPSSAGAATSVPNVEYPIADLRPSLVKRGALAAATVASAAILYGLLTLGGPGVTPSTESSSLAPTAPPALAAQPSGAEIPAATEALTPSPRAPEPQDPSAAPAESPSTLPSAPAGDTSLPAATRPTTASKASAPAAAPSQSKRRSTPSAPKPKTVAPARPSPTLTGEPDIGF